MGETALGPLKIGRHAISPPVLLAPMAGATDSALRILCKRQGAGLVCTELTSSHGLFHGNPRSYEFLRWTEEERPISAQLFGAVPEIMAEAARRVADTGADVIDINMGCWVPKVAKTGAGASLLRDLRLAAAVMSAVARAVDIPITVKTRVGWDGCVGSAVELARVAEACGVAAVAIHGRTAQQGFRGEADWSPIAEAAAAVRIPVIGNGDVRSPEDAVRLLRQTGCAAVMIGRAALGNPWIFREMTARLLCLPPPPPPGPPERLEMLWQHACLLAQQTHGATAELDAPLPACARGQLPHYLHGLPGANQARARLGQLRALGDVQALLEDLRDLVNGTAA